MGNVPATAQLMTPLEQVLALIAFEEERDDRLNDFDQVNRLDDTAMAYRPNLKPYYEVKKVLEDAGSVNGGPASALRSYDISETGSYTAAAKLRTGNFDVLKYEDGKLVEVTFDPKTGEWDGMNPEA